MERFRWFGAGVASTLAVVAAVWWVAPPLADRDARDGLSADGDTDRVGRGGVVDGVTDGDTGLAEPGTDPEGGDGPDAVVVDPEWNGRVVARRDGGPLRPFAAGAPPVLGAGGSDTDEPGLAVGGALDESGSVVAYPLASPVPGSASTPVWSPDGRHLAFLVERGDGGTDLYLAEVAFPQLRNPRRAALPSDDGPVAAGCPSWGSTADLVVHAGPTGGPARLYAVGTDGSVEELPLSTDGGAWCPSFAPGAASLAYLTDAAGNLDVATAAAGALVSTAEDERHVSFSPDGTSLLFSRQADTGADLIRRDIESGDEELLTFLDDINARPVWVTGDAIAYYAGAAGPGAAVEVWTEEGTRTLATDAVALGAAPGTWDDGAGFAVWSPAGDDNGSLVLGRVDGRGTLTVDTGYSGVAEPTLVRVGGTTLVAVTGRAHAGATQRTVLLADLTTLLESSGDLASAGSFE